MKAKKKQSGQPSLQKFYDSIDFSEWWEEWAHARNKNGTLKFPTIYAFIKTKTKVEKNRKLLWWVLGPTVDLQENQLLGNKEFGAFKQFDWMRCREDGFWHSSKNVEMIAAEANTRFSAIDQMRSVGKVTIENIKRMQVLIEQLDREYTGQLMLPNFTAQENHIRVTNYLSLRQAMTEQLHSSITMYGKTCGLDVQRLDALIPIIGASLMGISSSQESDPETQQKVKSYDNVLKMMLTKAAIHKMPLPQDIEESLKSTMNKPMLIDRKIKPN